MTIAKKTAAGVRCTLTTWVYGAIEIVANRYCEVCVSFGADQGPRTTFRLDPTQARELAARLVAGADAAERAHRGRVRALPPGEPDHHG